MEKKNSRSLAQFILNEEVIDEKVYLIISCEDYSVDWNIGYKRLLEECFYIKKAIQDLEGEFDYIIDYGNKINLKLRLPMKDIHTCRLYKEKFCENFPQTLNEWLSSYGKSFNY